MSSLLKNKAFIWTFSALYFLVLGYLLFFAPFRDGTTTRVNFMPFDSMVPLTVYTFKTSEDWWHWFINVPGNILAFMPIAVPLCALKKRFSKIIFALCILLIPCLAEALQFVFQTGSCDVDDVILNVTGIYLGLWFLNILHRQPRP